MLTVPVCVGYCDSKVCLQCLSVLDIVILKYVCDSKVVSVLDIVILKYAYSACLSVLYIVILKYAYSACLCWIL